MALRTTNSAESWEKIYQAYNEVSFVSYDFDSIKQSLIDYTKTYYPEVFSDYIESSEFIAMLEMFAYVAEQLAYRVDMVAHENFITTAQRKQSILRLAKLISYKATRNIPVRGLVKFNSVTTTERILDSRGTDLSGLTITWNDPNNANWKEQFILVMNRVLSNRFGQPSKSFQIGDVVMDLYSLRNDPDGLRNGVFPFSAAAGLDTYPMEIVPSDLDENGPFEREPDLTSPMSIIYANDGIGDGSDYTGFLGYVKQGTLTRIDYNIAAKQPDRRVDFQPTDINQTDVWVQKIENDSVSERWKQVSTISEQNLVFNELRDTRKKFEVDTRENDQITVIFGDGDFSDMPHGQFRFWMRQSANRSIVVQKNKIQNEPFGFSYTSTLGNTETCTFTFGLTTTLQNGAASETIEHIRQSAPSTYYAQNRMVNGQDHNTYMLKDPTIIRLKTINRTFAGQPKHIDWHDASGKYENIKLFGDDLSMQYTLGISSQTTSVSGQSLIDSVIEPLLSSSGVINALLHTSATDPVMAGVISAPRRKFIEDNRGNIYRNKDGAPVALISTATADGSLKEKTAIQGLIDRHWYGEPLEYVQDEASGTVMARIPDPDDFPKDDSRIYAASVPRTIDGVNKFPPGDIGSGLQPIAEQDYFALRYNRYMQGIGNGDIVIQSAPQGTTPAEVWTIEVAADGVTIDVRSNLRGTFPSGSIGTDYYIQPEGFQDRRLFFTITQGTTAFEQGDAFILENGDDLSATPPSPRATFPWLQNGSMFSPTAPVVNLNGWWEILGYSQLPDYASGILESEHHDLKFTSSAADQGDALKQHSWMIFIRKVRQQPTNTIIGYEIHNRDLKLTVTSPTTKFWYNSVDQVLDNETKNRVFDNIKVLRSNKDAQGNVLAKSQKYDVVGAVKNEDGVIDFNSLEVVPTDLLQEDSSGDLVPDRLLQFETFAASSTAEASYEYFELENPGQVLIEQAALDAANSAWEVGAFVDNSLTYGRRLTMPGEGGEGLDFMWQHFSPHTNIIDPSPTNIHDAYVMTRGYYDNVISYVRGTSTYAPAPPTPLELRNSYGYLLENKMLSDTIVMHPGKIRLLFGGLAEPQLRAKFKVVRSQAGTLTNERLKEEILNVINTFFDIDNWDFGDTFYATKLISLIHQRLPADIASVVLVPVYSTNSFGSLFTVEPGFDEILQSAAELSDIEVVESLTPTIIRQAK
jgi:hypothetical protein